MAKNHTYAGLRKVWKDIELFEYKHNIIVICEHIESKWPRHNPVHVI